MISVAMEPRQFPEYVQAVVDSGGQVVPVSQDVEALIWLDYSNPEGLEQMLDQNPQIKWVQLPFAGVDAFSEIIKRPIRFTSAKGSYREPVAEHALAMSLAMMRVVPERVKAKSWGRQFADSLYDSNVLIIGAGGITEELVKLMSPFRAKITVLRNKKQAMPGATNTLQLEDLDLVIGEADLVIIACALTEQTRGLFNAYKFSKMKQSAYLVNIARGPVINTDDLVQALNNEEIAGAAVDVTEPEPLPDGHPLWSAKNIIITPHTADTRAQVVRLFSERIRENIKAYSQGSGWVGEVDPSLGY